MRDLDADFPRVNSGGSDKKMFVSDQHSDLLEQWKIIDKKLEEIYLFSKVQLNAVLDASCDDAAAVATIIKQIEKEYEIYPSDIPINDYLYKTLMSMEEIKSKTNM